MVIDSDGKKLLSRKGANDEMSLLELVGDVLDINGEVLWAIDVNHGGAALLIGLLVNHDRPIAYLIGLSIHVASAGYRGEGKTDAKDAFVMSDQARTPRDVHLAAFAGLAPAPRDSGHISGNLKRPRRHNRALLRACYLSAMLAIQACLVSRGFYHWKRSEGKGHKQAVLALARRRLSVLWAMIRDNTPFHAPPPATASP